MNDKELIHLITEYAYLRDKIKLIAFKIKEELEERERDANRQIHIKIKTGHDIKGQNQIHSKKN